MVSRQAMVAVGLLSVTACGDMEPPSLRADRTMSQDELQWGLGQGDLGFLENAAAVASGMVQMGQLAMARSPSPMVHDYAQYIVRYAASIENFARQTARARSIELSYDLRVRDAYHLMLLHGRYGLRFDDAYVRYQHGSLERGTWDAQDGLEHSLDAGAQALARRMTHDLPQISQLVGYVDLHRGSVHDVPGALDGIIGGADPGGKDPGKNPAAPQPGPSPPPQSPPPQQQSDGPAQQQP